MHWGPGKDTIPEGQIRKHHLSVIKASIQEAEEFDIRERKDLKEALNYWKPLSPCGVKRFERGLKECSLQAITDAAFMIERLI